MGNVVTADYLSPLQLKSYKPAVGECSGNGNGRCHQSTSVSSPQPHPTPAPKRPLQTDGPECPHYSRFELESPVFNFPDMSIDSCPVLYPSWPEFNNFHAYMESLERIYARRYGMVKVVPPKGWKAKSGNYDSIDAMHIPGPIEQNAYGRGGVYECVHISTKSMTVGQFKRRTKAFEHVTDGLNDQETEDLFWKNVAFSSPLYAADIKLALMDSNAGSWNLDNLDSVLTQGMKQPLSGVNTSYCYFGSWKSFFCWHTEDMELSAINFLHSGKPKYWYGIKRADKAILECEAKIQFPSRFEKCPQHLRHKTSLINPYKLKAKYPHLQIHKQAQYAGEFILAFNGSYHCGFNSGFNIAEAVNYATFSWLKQINTAQSCRCRRDSVSISYLELADQLIKSKLKSRPEVKQFYNSAQLQMESDENQKEPTSRDNSSPTNQKQALKEKQMVVKAFRHKKIKKSTKKISIQGEEFRIDQWAECDKCKKWRRLSKKLKKSEAFTCHKSGSSCSKKQESSLDYITLKA